MPQVTLYATTSSGWGTAANATGAPNGTYATTTSVTTSNSMGFDFTSLPDNAVITEVYMGARVMSTVANNTFSGKLTICDFVARTRVVAAANTPTDIEMAVDARGFHLSLVRATGANLGPLNFNLTRSLGSGTASLDAAWLRFVYWLPTTTTTTYYATSVVSSDTTTNPNNILNAPDGAVATTVGTGSKKTITTLNSSSLADAAVMTTLRLGMRGSTDQVNNMIVGLYDPVGTSLQDSVAATPPNTLTDMEGYTQRIWSASAFKAMQLQWDCGSSSFNRTSNIDAIWAKTITVDRTLQDSGAVYASAITSSWTNPNNAVGAPDAVYATNSGTVTLAATIPAITLPADAVVYRVMAGVRRMSSASGSNSPFNVKYTVGANWTFAFPQLVVANTPVDQEIELDLSLFTPASLAAAKTLTYARTSGTSTASVDALWMRVYYYSNTQPSVGTQVQRWDGAAWQTSAAKRWDGAAWQTATTKRWDGTAWV